MSEGTLGALRLPTGKHLSSGSDCGNFVCGFLCFLENGSSRVWTPLCCGMLHRSGSLLQKAHYHGMSLKLTRTPLVDFRGTSNNATSRLSCSHGPARNLRVQAIHQPGTEIRLTKANNNNHHHMAMLSYQLIRNPGVLSLSPGSQTSNV